MPKFNADAEGLYEPIEIVIDGKEYRIEKVTTEMMEACMKDASEEGKDNIDFLCRQMVVFVGGQVSDFMSVDIRKLGGALAFIQKEIESAISGIKPKNESEPRP